MKKIFILITLVTICNNGFAQSKYTDSLKIEHAKAKDDTSRVIILANLAYYHRYQNLDTGMFYAAPLPPPNGGGFQYLVYKHEPTVWVSTKKFGHKILISVRDNGPGIPKKVLDKIFQHFFTTKPTGQGTGLSLSLSYDIVTKGHGGDLKVATKQGERTTFNVQLPTT